MTKNHWRIATASVAVLLMGIILFQYLALVECERLGGLYRFRSCFCTIDLMYAAKEGNLEAVQTQLNRGADINAIDNGNSTALSLATRMGEGKAALFVLEKGANPNTIDVHGGTPLMYAVGTCSSDVVKAIIQHGANLDVKNSEGRTPLAVAAKIANFQAAQVLVNAGANRSSQDMQGRTPLQIAQKELKDLGKTNIEPDPRSDLRAIINLLGKH